VGRWPNGVNPREVEMLLVSYLEAQQCRIQEAAS